MKEFQNKVVAVTGGNSGIGLAIAQKFDALGAKVAIFGRNEQTLGQAAQSMKQALAVQGDVSKITDLDRFYRDTTNKFGKIDIVIANAGIAESRHIEEVDEPFFDQIIAINYKGLFFTVQRAIPFLNQHASIILISSAAAHIGASGYTVYGSTKAAVSHLARTMSADLIDKGIRVNAISPGFVDTPILDDIKAAQPDFIKQISKSIPAGRVGNVDEIANTAVFLASPQSAFIVGADIVIDGGSSAISHPKMFDQKVGAI